MAKTQSPSHNPKQRGGAQWLKTRGPMVVSGPCIVLLLNFFSLASLENVCRCHFDVGLDDTRGG